MIKKTFLKRISLICRLGLFLPFLFSTGCGERSVKLTAKESSVFAGASADLKVAWEKALAADKAKDYVAAQTALDALVAMPLTEEQKLVLEKERADFGQRLWAAAEKNDPAAIKAVQTFEKPRSQKRGSPNR